MQCTGYSESCNALFRKHIFRNNVSLPEISERVRSYLHEKRAAEQDADSVKVTHCQPLLHSSGLLKDAKDLEPFCRNLTPYAIRIFRDDIATLSFTYVISDNTLVHLSDYLAEDSLQDTEQDGKMLTFHVKRDWDEHSQDQDFNKVSFLVVIMDGSSSYYIQN